MTDTVRFKTVDEIEPGDILGPYGRYLALVIKIERSQGWTTVFELDSGGQVRTWTDVDHEVYRVIE